MDYIPGPTAREQLVIATPEQDTYLLKRMAEIQVKLANIRMGKIGSIVKSSNGYEIGPDLETDQGPFENPKKYYEAVTRHRYMRCMLYGEYEGNGLDAGDLPLLFSICIDAITDNDTEEDFGLANRDLGPHHLIVDKNCTVLAMIDLDFIVFAPRHIVANLPCRLVSELDTTSSDLGVAKRTREYLNALSAAGRTDFQDVVKSPLAQMSALLQELDHDISPKSFPWDKLRSALRFWFDKESFVGRVKTSNAGTVLQD